MMQKYMVVIDEDMIIRAINTKQVDFLYCVYAFNKNFQYIGKKDQADGEPDQSDSDSESDDENSDNY